MKTPMVSIIIVQYKVKNELFECLKSIYNSKQKISHEVIIVDNEGDDSLNKELEKYKQVKYILSKKNLGFGGGNNLGAKKAVGKYLFFLNPDTLVKSNTIEHLYNFIESNKNTGIVSPLLVDINLNPFSTQSRKELTPLNAIYSFSFLRKFFPKKSIYNDEFLKNWDKKQAIEVEAIPGAALMISKKLFEKVNGFDEQFFLYFEENDISKRIRNLGYKLYIHPNSTIVHKVGRSTSELKDREDIFNKSRFLYLKKHYGVLKALFAESIVRINKTLLIMLIVLAVALFLRFSNISNSMQFIGDQGWFYLSARDLITEGKIPLVGITSSHTWLHQGPLWTYMLSVALFLGNFNPVSGAYLTALLGATTVLLIYKLSSEFFSKNVGLIGAALYAVSPLIVFFDRIPFDPTPIPLFTLLYFYSIYKWLRGQVLYFPLTIILLSFLYSLELATFSLFFPLFFIFLYGIYKKKPWAKNILNKKIIFYSILGFIISMFPIIIYDFSNGFKQTIVFLGWVIIYKPLSFLFKSSSSNIVIQFTPVTVFLMQNIQKLIFQTNFLIAVSLFTFSFLFLIFDLFKRKSNIENPRFLLLLFLIVSFGGILVNKIPSDAYVPVIFPLVIITVSLFFDSLIKTERIRYLTFVFLGLIITFNFYSSYKIGLSNGFRERIDAVNEIIELAHGREYNLIGKGPGSQFESFTTNYEYLLWWKGFPVSERKEKLKILITETKNGIEVGKL